MIRAILFATALLSASAGAAFAQTGLPAPAAAPEAHGVPKPDRRPVTARSQSAGSEASPEVEALVGMVQDASQRELALRTQIAQARRENAAALAEIARLKADQEKVASAPSAPTKEPAEPAK